MDKAFPKKPGLFLIPRQEGALPSVFVGTCMCGHTYFPPHLFGCEVCGKGPESLKISEYPAKGRLKAFAASHHIAKNKGKNVVFIGEIILENGPLLVANIEASNEETLKKCKNVTGKLIEITVNEKGEKTLDLIFEPVGGEK